MKVLQLEPFHLLFVVEDIQSRIQSLLALSESLSFTFNTAPTIELAVEQHRSQPADVVVFDAIQFGAARLAQFRASVPDVPLLAVVPCLDEELESLVWDAGATDVLYEEELTPPFFSRALRYALHTSRLERELVRHKAVEAISNLEQPNVGNSANLTLKGQLYQIIISHFPNGSVYLIDRQTRVLLSGGQGIASLGLTHEMISGKNLLEVLGQDDSYEEFRIAHERAIAGEHVVTEIELRGRTRLVHIIPVTEENGEIKLVVAMTQDVTERKQAEETLRQSQKIYTTLVQNFPNGIVFMLDRQKRLIVCEGQGTGRLGLDTQEVAGKPFSEVFGHLPSFEPMSRMLEFTLQGKEQCEELELYGRTCSVHMVPVWCESGTVSLVIAMTQDVTERRAHELERQQRREQLQQAYEELEVRVQERTSELEQLNRILHGQVAERQMVMGALRETVAQLERANEQIEQTNEELRANEALLLEGNHIFAGLTRLRVNSGAELQNALQVLTEAGCRLLDVTRCSIWYFNRERTHFTCLDRYEVDAVTHNEGTTFNVSEHPEYFRALETGRPIVASNVYEHPVTREFAKYYFMPRGIISTLDMPIINNGQIIGVFCFEHSGEQRHWRVEEQTVAASAAALCALIFEWRARAQAREELHWAASAAELARSEAELARIEAEEARIEAERANRAKSEFLSRMSHELRTPLNSILGFAQIMEMQPTELTDKQSQRLSYILKAGQHLLQLVNEVLDIAHVESGRLSFSLESVSISSAIQSAIELASPLCRQNKLEMHCEMGDTDKLFVRADRQRLSQVLLNLLSNASKYNRYGGSIFVHSEVKEKGWARISVHDTGTGVPPEQAALLFQPFERLGAENANIEGTGLGLALSKRLIEAMGGRMDMRSTLGQGSEFWLELPLDVSPVEQIENLPSTYRGFDDITQRHKILYIEDNLANLQVIQHMLEDLQPVRIISAMQGQIGLELARQHRPTLILLDLHLPDVSGDEVLQRLLADPLTREIPVVVISADATPHRIQRLLELGANDYLTKPLDVRRFLDVVYNHLNQNEITL